MDATEARKLLENKGIAFNEESYIRQVKTNCHENVELFLLAGMSPNVKNDDGKDVLILAIEKKAKETVKMLMKYDTDTDALIDSFENKKSTLEVAITLAPLAAALSGILIALIGGVFTFRYNTLESKRLEESSKLQNDLKQSELVQKFLPSLSPGKNLDEQGIAFAMVRKLGGIDLLTALLKFNPNGNAVKVLTSIDEDVESSTEEKIKARKALSFIRTSSLASAETQKNAEEALLRLKPIGIDSIKGYVSSIQRKPKDEGGQQRKIDEVMLMSVEYQMSAYKGEDSIQLMDSFHKGQHYDEIAYHFIVTPDGKVFPGRSIEKVGAYCKGKNETTVGVAMYLKGEEEVPTAEQEKALYVLVEALLERLNIDPEKNFDSSHGFKTDVAFYTDLKHSPWKGAAKDSILKEINKIRKVSQLPPTKPGP